MIYTNITYKQFEEIKDYLSEKILDYKKTYAINNKNSFKFLAN